ncbi:MAG: glbO [Phycisphaerales bacterium]|nr:glbO [Phycisphaerales bacterium]
MSEPSIDDLYHRIGEAKLRQVVAAFYRQVPSNPVLGPMYPPDDLAAAEERLYGFLAQRFGGPTTYSEQRGHPRLRMRHAPFAVDVTARDHWIATMGAAIDEAELPVIDSETMKHFLFSVAHQMQNR